MEVSRALPSPSSVMACPSVPLSTVPWWSCTTIERTPVVNTHNMRSRCPYTLGRAPLCETLASHRHPVHCIGLKRFKFTCQRHLQNNKGNQRLHLYPWNDTFRFSLHCPMNSTAFEHIVSPSLNIICIHFLPGRTLRSVVMIIWVILEMIFTEMVIKIIIKQKYDDDDGDMRSSLRILMNPIGHQSQLFVREPTGRVQLVKV